MRLNILKIKSFVLVVNILEIYFEANNQCVYIDK